MTEQRKIDKEGSVECFDEIWSRQSKSSGLLVAEAQTEAFIEQRLSKLGEFGFPPTGKVLNCGCGKGSWSIPLSQRGYRVDNLDLSENALQLVKEAYQACGLPTDVYRSDLRSMPFKDDSYDVVASFGVLEHFDDLQPVVDEMVRVLKPGGYFFADIVTKRVSIRTVEEMINRVVGSTGSAIKGDLKRAIKTVTTFSPEFYENGFPPNYYFDLAVSAGLEDVAIEGVRAFPIFIAPRSIDNVFAALHRRANATLGRLIDYKSHRLSLKICAVWCLHGKKPTG